MRILRTTQTTAREHSGGEHAIDEQAPPQKMAPLGEKPSAQKYGEKTIPGKSSMYALRLEGLGVFETRARLEKLGLAEPPITQATSIDGLLAQLPEQTEIKRILRVWARDEKITLRPLEELERNIPPLYHQAAEKIARLTRFFNPVELYTIDDPAGTKVAFLEAAAEGRLQNPKFTYRQSLTRLEETLAKNNTSLEVIEKELRDIQSALHKSPRPASELEKVVRSALYSKLADDLATIELAHGLAAGDDTKVREAFSVKYGGRVDEALFGAARIVYGYLVETQAHAKKKRAEQFDKGKLPAEIASYLVEPDKMSAGELKEAIEWMLAGYYRHYEEKTGREFPPDLKYRVVVSGQYSAIDVRDKSSEGPVIGLPEKPRSYKKHLELLRHEIDQHVRQSLNGRLMFGFGGGALKVDEETWYEGLAKHAEINFAREYFGDESEPSLPYFTFAIKMAEEGYSFVETFLAQRELRLAAGNGEKTAAENAWNATYRAFRGHTDTSNAHRFALPKDQAYLRGWMLQSQLAERGLSHLNEAAIAQLDGLSLLARFDFSAKDLLFPDLNLTERWFEEVLSPRIEAEMRDQKSKVEV
jgi:hypothetical protein